MAFHGPANGVIGRYRIGAVKHVPSGPAMLCQLTKGNIRGGLTLCRVVQHPGIRIGVDLALCEN